MRPLTADELTLVKALDLPCFRCRSGQQTHAIREYGQEIKVCRACAKDEEKRLERFAKRRS
jgi:hypothetical protein